MLCRQEPKLAPRANPTSARELQEHPKKVRALPQARQVDLLVGPTLEKVARPLVKRELPKSLGLQVEPGSVRSSPLRQEA